MHLKFLTSNISYASDWSMYKLYLYCQIVNSKVYFKIKKKRILKRAWIRPHRLNFQDVSLFNIHRAAQSRQVQLSITEFCYDSLISDVIELRLYQQYKTVMQQQALWSMSYLSTIASDLSCTWNAGTQYINLVARTKERYYQKTQLNAFNERSHDLKSVVSSSDVYFK